MSLRDYFAVHADLSHVDFRPPRVVALYMGEDEPGAGIAAAVDLSARLTARLRYQFADAMLAAREAPR
jgi:hypothetical protein